MAEKLNRVTMTLKKNGLCVQTIKRALGCSERRDPAKLVYERCVLRIKTNSESEAVD